MVQESSRGWIIVLSEAPRPYIDLLVESMPMLSITGLEYLIPLPPFALNTQSL